MENPAPHGALPLVGDPLENFLVFVTILTLPYQGSNYYILSARSSFCGTETTTNRSTLP
jgi:hypothetical protein